MAFVRDANAIAVPMDRDALRQSDTAASGSRPMLGVAPPATLSPINTSTEVSRPMVRTFARTRLFPIVAWAYVVALGIQVFFAGMYVFAGAHNIELHRNMAHVIGLLTGRLLLAVFAGRVPEKRLTFGVLGLLVVQGMLVHLNQWFGFDMVAALHPVNALVLTYASLTLAKRATAYWQTDAPRTVAMGSSGGMTVELAR
jgi:hypothetical protein